MEKFFYPKNVAVIGASHEERKIGHVIFKNLLEKFKGKVYPVNPKTEPILGQKVYPSVLDIEEEIDLAIIAVNASIVPKVLEECGKKGIKNVVIISSGFSETGSLEGKKAEEKIKEIARAYGIRIIGPNTIGIFNSENGLDATFFLEKDVKKPKEGCISFFTQSGTIGILTLDILAKENIGIAKLVSYGNALDVNEADLIEYFSTDEKTKVIAGFIESVRNGRKFLEVLRKNKKSIVLLKGGKTSFGARATSSHTASLAGDYKVYSNVLKQFNVIEAETWEDLIDYLKILSTGKIAKGKRLVIITNAGGFGVLASDYAFRLGLELPEPSEKLKEEMKKYLPLYASVRNPIDITADADIERYEKILRILDESEEFDMLLIVVLIQTPMLDERIVDVLKEIKKPFAVCMSGSKAEEIRKNLRLFLPIYESPERAVKALKIISELKA
ncbi:MAG: CoA-binding protein [Candidatus Aenigmarchaeota archaeon]|nr:CoA-binding protein [Candidatus Aenigmarchaeota archaeon]